MPPALFEYTERNFWVYVFGRFLFWGVHPLLTYRYEINAIYSGRSRPSDKGVGGGSFRPWDKGEGAVSKKIFLALQTLVWSKNKGGTPLDLTLPAPCWVTLSCNTEKLIPSYCTPSRGVGL